MDLTTKEKFEDYSSEEEEENIYSTLFIYNYTLKENEEDLNLLNDYIQTLSTSASSPYDPILETKLISRIGKSTITDLINNYMFGNSQAHKKDLGKKLSLVKQFYLQTKYNIVNAINIEMERVLVDTINEVSENKNKSMLKNLRKSSGSVFLIKGIENVQITKDKGGIFKLTNKFTHKDLGIKVLINHYIPYFSHLKNRRKLHEKSSIVYIFLGPFSNWELEKNEKGGFFYLQKKKFD